MSIPPLVCSTPPPPDQCDEDKDPEDFDVQYNLSQDEEDDNYDFGSFSTFTHFQSSQKISEPVVTKAICGTIHDLPKANTHSIENINEIVESKSDEETNVEDLNLEDLKVAPDAIQKSDVTDSSIENKTIEPETDTKQEPDTLNCLTDSNSPSKLQTTSMQPDEFIDEPPSIDQSDEPPSYVDEIIAAVDSMQITSIQSDIPFDEPIQELAIEQKEITERTEIPTPEVVNDNDDFGDFDDFHFTSPGDHPPVLDSCDNPWDKNDNATDNDFGDFKAKFDDNDDIETKTLSSVFQKPENGEEVGERSCAPPPEVSDDDFGDFNDFQSSSTALQTPHSTENEESMPSQQIPLLNIHDEEKLMEQITIAINSIFVEEIGHVEEPLQNLDSMLGVTWGHLLQIDERQPYMVSWNNSAGQKTLLKALCIDSRNILFGPKWNYNMPKYAATLSVAPLQPQKPISSPNLSQVESLQPVKSSSKPGTWNDPFTSDGQDFTYAEALLLDLEHLMATLDQMTHNHSTLKISELLSHACNPEAAIKNPDEETGPTDLDVFEASTSSKSDKIFSSTLNVQPLRQISLPDTHIFTPTDSETPRSTTIHYDNTPTVLLPQTIIDSKSETNFKETQLLSSKASATPTADTDEYWDFQDFKGPTNTTATVASIAPQTSEPLTTNRNATCATQVLQPIKVEPTIPTLNWPDPGEVKEIFDDFSAFVSSSSMSNPQQQKPIEYVSTVDNKPAIEPADVGEGEAVAPPNEKEKIGDFDDDFETFQSAVPSISSADFNFTSVNKVSNAVTNKPILSSQAPPQTIKDFDFAFHNLEIDKSDTISKTVITTNEASVQNSIPIFPSSLEVKHPPVQSSSLNSGLLQPTPASSSTTLKNKSGQILQPLSLESFSQINWPNPGIDLQDLSRFNPVETLNSLKSDLSVNSQSKIASPVNSQKSTASSQPADDDWGEFVSSKPKPQTLPMSKKQASFPDDDEWTDFVSSPSVKPQQNGLSTISLNVHTNFQSNASKFSKGSKLPLEIPTLNYITPKSGSHKTYNDRHFQNL